MNDLKQQVGEPAHVGRLNRFFAGRHLLVMAQIALSLMLLFSAGLFFRGAMKAGALYPGFDRRGGIATEMDFSLGNGRTRCARSRRCSRRCIACKSSPASGPRRSRPCFPYGNFTDARRVMRMDEAAVAKTDPKAPEAGKSGSLRR